MTVRNILWLANWSSTYWDGNIVLKH